MSNKDKLAENPYGTNELNQATIDLLTDANYQNIILPEPLQAKIDSGEPVLAYLFSPLCSHCKNMTPKLMPIAEENDVQVDQLNVLEYDQGFTTYNIDSTPTLIYFDNGVEVTRLVGDAPEETIHQFFNDVVLKN